MRIKSILLTLFFLLALAVPGWGAIVDRYVDASVGASGDGTIGSPWKLLSDIKWTSGTNNIKAIVDAGNTAQINLARGSVWTGASGNTLEIGYSGTSSAHIIIQPYGTGTPPQIKSTTGNAIKLNTAKNYVDFYGIHIGPWIANNAGIYCQGSTNITANYCLIDREGDLSLSNTNGIVAYLSSTITVNNCTIARVYTGARTFGAGDSIALINTAIWGVDTPTVKATNATVTYENCDFAGYRTTAAIQGTAVGAGNLIGGLIKIKQPYRYGQPKTNISIDDVTPNTSGVDITFVTNLITELASRNCKPTLNVISSWGLTWTQLSTWQNAGYELLSHSWSHQIPSNLGLFYLTYTGTGDACYVTVSGNHLYTTVVGGPGDENLDLDLTTNPNDLCGGGIWPNKLIATLENHAAYMCSAHANLQYGTRSRTLPDIAGTDKNIKTQQTFSADNEKLYRDQLSHSKEVMAANLTGWNGQVYVVPAGDYSTNGDSWILDYYQAARAALDAPTQTLKTGQSITRINSISPSNALTQDVLTKHGRGVMYSDALCGRITTFYGHTVSNLSTTQWGYVLDGALSAGAQYTTLQAIADYIGSQTLASPGVYTGTTEQAVDFQLLADSPCRNAGKDLGLTTDILGKPIKGLPDIGAYEYQDTSGNAIWFGSQF